MLGGSDGLLLDPRGHMASFLLHVRSVAASATANGKERKLLSVWKCTCSILFALAPTMVEQPFFGELVRVSQFVAGNATNVTYAVVKRFYLRITEFIAVLLGMQLGMVQDLVPDPVPDATDHRLIKKEGLHRDMPAAHLVEEILVGEKILINNRVGPILNQGRCLPNVLSWAIDKTDATKASRVDERDLDLGITVGLQLELPVFGRPLVFLSGLHLVVIVGVRGSHAFDMNPSWALLS